MTKFKLFDGADAAPDGLPDIEQLLDGLAASHGGLPADLSVARLRACDHLAVATNGPSGAPTAVLGAVCRHAEVGAFVQIAVAFGPEGRVGEATIGRLLGMTLLRVAGVRETPRIVATALGLPQLHAALRRLAAALPSVALFPPDPAMPVPLAAVRLARQVARSIAPNSRLDLATGGIEGGASYWAGYDSARSTGAQHRNTACAMAHAEMPHRRSLLVLDMTAASATAIEDCTRRMFRRR